jgi:hypothetical protein
MIDLSEKKTLTEQVDALLLEIGNNPEQHADLLAALEKKYEGADSMQMTMATQFHVLMFLLDAHLARLAAKIVEATPRPMYAYIKPEDT